MHRSGSMKKISPLVIALVGQTRSHTVQAGHWSVMKWDFHFQVSFPAQFLNRLELEREYLGMAQRYDAHATLTVVLFTDPVVQETWKWKSHFITDKCTTGS